MTGTSARETLRPARRMIAPSNRDSSSITPPVLFRLPSISLSASSANEAMHAAQNVGGHADGTTGNASAFAVRAVSDANAAHSTTNMQSSGIMASDLVQDATAKKHEAIKQAGQRLLNTLIVMLLLVALAIVSLLAFRSQGAKPGIVKEPSASPSDPLATLADLKVPELQSKTVDAPTTPDKPHAHEHAQSLILGMDTGELGISKATATAQVATAQVQLGVPVPLQEQSNTLLTKTNLNASSGSIASPTIATRSELPLTTPRYETVSTPSATNSSTEKPSSKDSGASPSLWDGAGSSTSTDVTGGSGLVLTKPSNSDSPASISAGPAGSARTNATSASTGPAESGRTYSDTQLKPSPQTGRPDDSESVNLGVTVGGGLPHPTNLGENSVAAQPTSTPELDAATIGRKYIEFKEQKNARLASSANSLLGSNTQSGTTGGATNRGAAGHASSTSNVGLAPTSNPAAAAYGVPYGTTADTAVTPYVRNAPGAQPSGLVSQSPSTPLSLGYSTNATAPGSGTSISPRTTNYPAPGYSSPTPGSNTAVPAPGAPSATRPMYSSPTYSSPTYSSPTYSSPTYSSPTNTQPSTNPSPTSTTYPNPTYSSGPAPIGMIGQSGYATAPSGDFIGGTPASVSGTVGYATSTVGAGMPTDARPMAPAVQGSATLGAPSLYGSSPQYR